MRTTLPPRWLSASAGSHLLPTPRRARAFRAVHRNGVRAITGALNSTGVTLTAHGRRRALTADHGRAALTSRAACGIPVRSTAAQRPGAVALTSARRDPCALGREATASRAFLDTCTIALPCTQQPHPSAHSGNRGKGNQPHWAAHSATRRTLAALGRWRRARHRPLSLLSLFFAGLARSPAPVIVRPRSLLRRGRLRPPALPYFSWVFDNGTALQTTNWQGGPREIAPLKIASRRGAHEGLRDGEPDGAPVTSRSEHTG